MRFIDEVTISVRSGEGGQGALSFRREKFVPFGGPDGGNGGSGGNICFEVDPGLNTLVKFRGKRNYFAPNGTSGSGRQRDGKCGDDLVLKVPKGTLVRDKESGEVLLDLKEGHTLFLEGGRGGLGNAFFKTSTNQAPRHHQPGEPGIDQEIVLELKLLADVGLVGLPNAGKSTLLSVLSNARPKIADYPFTTLIPQLGVVQSEDDSFVMADIPGLIQGATQGKGLGIQFLKHIERTKFLVHLIDCSLCLDPFEAFESYVQVREELTGFGHGLENKRELVCLSKMDTLPEEEQKNFQQYFESQLDKNVLTISSAANQNTHKLKTILAKALKE